MRADKILAYSFVLRHSHMSGYSIITTSTSCIVGTYIEVSLQQLFNDGISYNKSIGLTDGHLHQVGTIAFSNPALNLIHLILLINNSDYS